MSPLHRKSMLQCCVLTLLLLIPGSACVLAQDKGDQVKSDTSKIVTSLSDLPAQIEADNIKTKDLFDRASDSVFIASYKNSIAALETSVRKAREQTEFFLQSYARPWLIQNLNAKWIRLNDDWVDLSIKISRSTENNENRLRACQEMKSKWARIKTEISTDSIMLHSTNQFLS